MNITNINTLGINYNVIGDLGQRLKRIKVIRHEDFLATVLGEYNEEFYEDSNDYIASCVDKLSGFVPMYDIYWFTTVDEDFDVMDVLIHCMKNNYSYAIVEIINPLDEFGVFDEQ